MKPTEVILCTVIITLCAFSLVVHAQDEDWNIRWNTSAIPMIPAEPPTVTIKFTAEDVYRCSIVEPGHYVCEPVDYPDPLAMGCIISGTLGLWICP